jgi:hypothetical protein
LKGKQTLPAAYWKIQSLPQFASQALLPVRVQIWVQRRMTEPVGQSLQMTGEQAGCASGLAPHFRNEDAIHIAHGLTQFRLDAVDDLLHALLKSFVGIWVTIHTHFAPDFNSIRKAKSSLLSI